MSSEMFLEEGDRAPSRSGGERIAAHFEISRSRVVGPKRVVGFDAVKARDTSALQSNVSLSRSKHCPSEAETGMTAVDDQAVYVTGFRGTYAPDDLVIPLKQDRRDDVLTAPDHVEFACACPVGELNLSDLSWSPLPDALRHLPFGCGVPESDDCTGIVWDRPSQREGGHAFNDDRPRNGRLPAS